MSPDERVAHWGDPWDGPWPRNPARPIVRHLHAVPATAYQGLVMRFDSGARDRVTATRRQQTVTNFAYAVLHDETGRVFVGTKYQRGYYFSGNSSGVRRAGTELNLAGLSALPGGKIEEGETIQDAAEREFHEETGEQIRNIDMVRRVHDHRWLVEGGNGRFYGAAYFRVDQDSFNWLVNSIVNVNLPAGRRAQAAIIAGQITAYDQVHPNFPDAPFCNELATGFVLNVRKAADQQTIDAWPDSIAWYRNILRHLDRLLAQ
ncbi:NUDIX hydrolase [Micromonospora sp. NPDC005257]|uniref:NUDIX hydrolase n=1 Tax=Micromonospora sp. NPDC005257 TaxID=3364230 RepID=UPI00369CB18E